MSREIVNLLTKLPVPDLVPSQLAEFNPQTLRARHTERFFVNHALECLRDANGRTGWALDIGGTALKAQRFTIQNGVVVFSPDDKVIMQVEGENEKKGKNYLAALMQLSETIEADDLIGVSVAGLVENGKLKDSPNLPSFIHDLESVGGLDAIFRRKISVANDAVAGLKASIVGASQHGLAHKNVLYLIHGGGIGGAAKDGEDMMISLEPGHIRASRELNPREITTPCGMEEQTFTCLERIGSMGAIEAIWKNVITAWQELNGRQIAELMYSGDKKALDLFNNSANILAKHHTERGQQYKLVPTSDFGIDNACLMGAAISAVIGS